MSRIGQRSAGSTGIGWPNFFILGGVKCGTTSLYRYLGQHPEIFLPSVKEPCFFAYAGVEDPPAASITTTAEAYESLYAGRSGQRVIGDASPVYLYHSAVAGPRIAERAPTARCIVSLRNPVQRAYSQYRMAVQEGVETLDEFGAALAAESARVARGEPMIFHYARQSFYHDDLSRYMELFGKANVRVYLFEELQKDPLALAKDIFGFLDVDTGFVPQIGGRYNATRRVRNNRLRVLLARPNIIKRAAAHVLPLRTRRRLKTRLMRMNVKPHRIPEAVREHLVELFREDVERTSSLLGRDLTGWLR